MKNPLLKKEIIQMNEAQIGEMWMMFSDYIDKKQMDIVAERYVELLADFGVRDRTLSNVIGMP